MILGAIADDLTGATDLALMLTRGGMRVLQVVGVPHPDADFDDADAVIVSLKSRTIPAPEAQAMSVSAAKVLLAKGARQLLFKYCSTFDSTDEGNIGPVTDALLDLLGDTRTLACPAFPTNKRTVYKGHLFVGDVLLSDSPMRDHPLTPMRDGNLVRVLARQTNRPVSLIDHDIVRRGSEAVRESFASLEGIAIVDAISNEDLYEIGAASMDLRLITGGSGIAMGLPEAYHRRGLLALVPVEASLEAPAGRNAVLAGSCSAATRRQIEYGRAQGMPALKIEAAQITDGTFSVEAAADFAERETGALPPLIYSSADSETVRAVQQALGAEEAGELVERFMGELARTLARRGFTRFLIAGGETSGAVIRDLGVTTLQIGPEIDPGVPWTISTGSGPELALALKSGNFGADDFFVKAWERLK
ncbi:four-carbon acid sugar kinase family protein [Devosia sp. PTR5]|uniref:3-oxo-tetronate kinase n=1 Tax=Devosia oryzisoli TaxID=2774138 RepID=A0A927ITX6_9HYPH|nr:3-oxo-tetronate kinase [Devosia oryzisoli]MBD8066151.1 four-carbon acid sugar kinase family protein [Devosia oryzisoli]